MYTITITEKFEAAHRLQGHQGRCDNIHGHSYVVKVYVEKFGNLGADKMVMDFKDLKNIVHDMIDKYDHRLILDKDDPLVNAIDPIMKAFNMSWATIDGRPTAENFARLFAHSLRSRREKFQNSCMVSAVEVFETATSCACYQMTPAEWNATDVGGTNAS